MEHNLDLTVRLLGRTPASLDALLRDMPQAWTSRNEGKNTWSAFDVVGHLIHGERTDWMPRAKMILQFGETHVRALRSLGTGTGERRQIVRSVVG